MPEPRNAGYSGKSLAQKLGLGPGVRAAVYNPPAHYADLLDTTDVPEALAEGPYGLIHAFVRRSEELPPLFALTLPLMIARAALWVSWPKKASPMHEGLTEDGVRAAALATGLVDVKVCAVDADWSALKCVRRKAP